MTLKEYFFKTIVTTKFCLRISTVIFTVIFVLFILAMKIGGKLEPEETFLKLYNGVEKIVFVYGIVLFIWGLALISSYQKAKNTINLFNTIPLDIKNKFCFQLREKQLNIKYNYLDFEILGLCEKNRIEVDKVEKNIRIILYAMLKTESNFHKQKISFDQKYKLINIELNGCGLLKKINAKKWKQISTNEIEIYIRELVEIAQKEGFRIIRTNYAVDEDE